MSAWARKTPGRYNHDLTPRGVVETSVEVRVAPDPLRAVINGAGQMLTVGEMTRL